LLRFGVEAVEVTVHVSALESKGGLRFWSSRRDRSGLHVRERSFIVQGGRELGIEVLREDRLLPGDRLIAGDGDGDGRGGVAGRGRRLWHGH
jgi:hypothetical protein